MACKEEPYCLHIRHHFLHVQKNQMIFKIIISKIQNNSRLISFTCVYSKMFGTNILNSCDVNYKTL